MADGNGKKNGSPNVLAIVAALAALGVGGGGIGIMGNQSSTAEELSKHRAEFAALKVLMADEEKRMIALIALTEESMEEEIGTLRETVHKLELDFARLHGHN